MLPFLPALLGAGLQTGLGLTALQAGLATGLGTAIATKDLSKGLTAGLGAFGGANLSSSLGQAGQAATAAQAGQQAVTSGSPGMAASYGEAAKMAGGNPISQATLGTQTTAMTGAPLTGADLTKQAATQYGNLGTSAERLASVGEGFSAIGRDPAALQAAGGAGSLTMSGLTALTPTLETEMDYTIPGGPAMIRPSSYDPSTGMFTDLEPYPARSGGVIPGLASQVRMQQGGRFLSGGGDGMSDSIRANIDGTMEARLSDGEFVIPADVVSGLGNGSSDAGADRLYTMMDRVREERTGTTKQAPEINARSTMPA